MIDLDDERALAATDAAGSLGIVAALPSHCEQGYATGMEVDDLPSLDGVTALTLCGMGGSAVAGDIVRALFRDRLGVPVDVQRSPQLPAHCGVRSLVVCSSYSGTTAETLACFHEAVRRGCRVMVVTSGGELGPAALAKGVGVVPVPSGFMPRAALGYLAFATMGALEKAGLLPSMRADVEETVEGLYTIAARLGPTVRRLDNPAKELAWQVGDRTPVIWGAEGIGAVAASRWKTQFNENAKMPAWSAALPELDHNEVVGWAHPAGRGYLVIALRHEGESPDVAVRFGPSLRIAEDAGAAVEEVWAAGRSSLGRLFSLVMMGDFASTYHALGRGVDPTPVSAIVRLKAILEESAS